MERALWNSIAPYLTNQMAQILSEGEGGGGRKKERERRGEGERKEEMEGEEEREGGVREGNEGIIKRGYRKDQIVNGLTCEGLCVASNSFCTSIILKAMFSIRLYSSSVLLSSVLRAFSLSISESAAFLPTCNSGWSIMNVQS